MRKLAFLLAGAAALIAGPALQARDHPSGEQKLARLLDGRVAGRPVSCLSQFDTQDMQVIDHTALVYRVGKTLYVNRPSNADQLNSDDILVTELHTGQLCRLDIGKLHDRSTGMFTGFVGFENFVPYRRAG